MLCSNTIEGNNELSTHVHHYADALSVTGLYTGHFLDPNPTRPAADIPRPSGVNPAGDRGDTSPQKMSDGGTVMHHVLHYCNSTIAASS